MSQVAEAPAHAAGTTTVVTRVRDNARRYPRRVALREKRLGIWREHSWTEYWDSLQDVGHSLLALGIEPGDRVAVQSENRPEWVFADLGNIAVRGVTVGLYPTNPSDEVRYLLADSAARVLFAEDQEQVDKVLAVVEDLPALERIVYFEPRGVRGYDDPRLMSWDDFVELGRRHRADDPDAVEQRMAAAGPEDLAVLIYTSGTTGPPKGAMLTVGNIEFATMSAGSSAGLVHPPLGPRDVLLSYLPLCHVYERLLTCWLATSAASQVHFAESIETVVADLRQVQPTLFASVPRILEKIHSAVEIRAGTASFLKRSNYRAWSRAAAWMGQRRAGGQGRHTLATRLVYAAGYPFLFRALKDRIGLRKCRFAVSGAAPIAPDILRWFMGIGVPIVEAYGLTESSAVGTANRLGRVRLGTVGEPLPEVELRLGADTGEILLRHAGVFRGYWNKPEATAETIDGEGWLHTGDVGELVEETHLKIVDRIKDIIITAGGKNISPSEIENALKSSPFVKEAVVIGDRRSFLSALIGIDLETVGAWAQTKRLPFTTYRDLSRKPEVIKLIGDVVGRVNERFARVEQIKKFRLIPKELDHEEGELTATQKVKRAAVTQVFAELIADMYEPGSTDAA
jgi:long-chain acyl-CoA synthetase